MSRVTTMTRSPHSAHNMDGPRDWSHLVAIPLGICGIVNGNSYSNLASALSICSAVFKANGNLRHESASLLYSFLTQMRTKTFFRCAC